MRVCYMCVKHHYLTMSKGLPVLWSVLGGLSLHPQRVQCVSSAGLEATGRAVTPEAPRFPSEDRAVPVTAPRCRPRSRRRHVGSRARRHLVAPERWWREGRGTAGPGAAPAEGALVLLVMGRNTSVSKCCRAVSVTHL